MVEERTLQEGSSKPMSESDIMDKVLGVRRGHRRGRGRKLANEASSSNCQSSGPRMVNLEEVNEMFNNQQNFNKAQVEYLISIHAALQDAKIKVPKFPNFPNFHYPAMVEEQDDEEEEDEDYEEEEEEEDEE